MVFSSVIFIFYFLPLLLAVYFLTPKRFRRARNMILLVFSLGFYAYGEPKYVVIMIASILINYVFGFFVARAKEKNLGLTRLLVALAVVANLGILVYFKYTGFILTNLNSAFHLDLVVPNIIMPIGISFFTFQGMSYVLDIYFGHAKAQKNPLNVALYISLFPQLIAGPIVRYETVAEEIGCRNENRSEIASGIARFMFGLGKKIIIANSVGFVADTVFAKSPDTLTASLAWIGTFAYTMQIYFDFSGYSDMAIGLGRVFGFHFLENFNFPYISKSITEFWRRWHISLSTWFRDYLYIPLGGNRVSVPKHVRNILVVWLLTGIWHGAAWNFIAWGVFYGVILLVEKFFLGKYLKKAWAPVQHVYALLLIMLGWVLFRAPDMAYAWGYVKALFGFGAGLWDTQSVYLLLQYGVVFVISIVASLPVSKWLEGRVEQISSSRRRDFVDGFVKYAAAFAVFLLSVLYLTNSSFNPFIYFRF